MTELETRTAVWASQTDDRWKAGSGAIVLVSWPEDDEGETHVRARAVVASIVEATRATIAWETAEKPAHDGPEGMLGIFHRAIVRAEGERVFRIAAMLRERRRGYEIAVRVEWTTTPSATLPDHDEVARAVDDAARKVRALVESPRFGAATIEDLATLEGVEAAAIDPKRAFDRRCNGEGESDSATGRLEHALGSLKAIVYDRPDYRTWTERLAAVLGVPAALALARLGEPWGYEVELDLKLVLVARAFPRSKNPKAERARPLATRIEAVLEAGGLVYGLRGKSAGTAVLLVCPGPLAAPSRD